MTPGFSHLRLSRWPFPIVPDPDYSTFIAGRPRLKADIEQLLIALSRRDTSSIHVVWSWLGAGKTHSLLYLCHEARARDSAMGLRLVPVYTEFPKGTSSFVELYAKFFDGLSPDDITEAYLEVGTSHEGEKSLRDFLAASPDLSVALRVLAVGKPPDQLTAWRWLRAENMPIATYRTIGIGQRVATSEQATRTLATIIGLFQLASRLTGARGTRVIWIIDELQRLRRSSPRVVGDVNAGLHSLFNACPSGLSLILSFSGNPDPARLPDWFSPELRDRIGTTKVMLLPPLGAAEALDLVREVLAHFRTGSQSADAAYFPFTRATCQFILAEAAQRAPLRPRTIMHAFNAVLEDAEPKLERGDFAVIDVEVARAALRDHAFLSASESEDSE
jgi:hypothetical protein